MSEMHSSDGRPQQYRAPCDCASDGAREIRMHSLITKGDLVHTSDHIEWFDDKKQIQCNNCGEIKIFGGDDVDEDDDSDDDHESIGAY